MTAWEVFEPVLTLGLSVSSIVVAAVVGAAVIQSQKDQREYHKIAIRPQLHLWLYADKQNGEVTLEIMNNGLGPGIIRKIEFFRRQRPEKRFPLEEVRFYLPSFSFDATRIVAPSSLADPFSLAAGQRLFLLRVEFHDKGGCSPYRRTQLTSYMNEMQKTVGCEVTYTDVYGEETVAIDP